MVKEGLLRGTPAKPIVRVTREGEAISVDGKVFHFTGKSRWDAISGLIDANGGFVKCAKNFKALFANNKEAKAFYDAAIEAEGLGRNGTGRYRLKT